MADSYRQGFVFVQNVFSGIIRETDSGYMFEYDRGYLASDNPLAVSLTLPLQESAFESKTLFPFFDGLIPEGWLLDVVSRNWKIDRRDRFGLLIAVCRDSEKAAEKMIKKILSMKEKFSEVIMASFLSETEKSDFLTLLEKRFEILA